MDEPVGRDTTFATTFEQPFDLCKSYNYHNTLYIPRKQ
jgi:hypothetical protein